MHTITKLLRSHYCRGEWIMRRTAVVVAALALSVLPTAPALGAPPEISQRSCEESGGTFTRDQGTKSCTTVTTTQVAGPVVTQFSPPEQVSPLVTHQYVGESRRIFIIETTTTRSQKGNGEVSTVSTPATVGSFVEPLTCTRIRTVVVPPAVTSQPVALNECATRGLYNIP